MEFNTQFQFSDITNNNIDNSEHLSGIDRINLLKTESSENTTSISNDERSTNNQSSTGNFDSQESEFANEITPLNATKLMEVSLSVFDKVDTNGDSILDNFELFDAAFSNTFKGQEAQTIAALYYLGNDIKDFSKDQWSSNAKGISKRDLNQFHSTAMKRVNKEEAVEYAKTNFEGIDVNGNGRISKKELESISNQSNELEVNHLLANFKTVKTTHRTNGIPIHLGITEQDLNYYGNNRRRDWNIDNTTEGMAVLKAEAMFQKVSDAQRPGDAALYEENGNLLDSINHDYVYRNNIGSDRFEAALASVANIDSYSIYEAIETNQDGSYTVTFPGDTANPVIVDAPNPIQIALLKQTYNDEGKYRGHWPEVMKNAFKKYIETDASSDDSGLLFSSEGILELLTGKDFITTKISDNPEEILEKLATALMGKEALTVRTDSASTKSSSLTKGGFLPNSTYIPIHIRDLDRDKPKILLRSSVRASNSSTRIFKDITLDQLMENFSEIATENSLEQN